MTDTMLSPQKTWIPVGVAIGCLVSSVGLALWVSNNFKDLAFSNRELSSALGRVEVTLKGISDDSVKRQELHQWVELFRAKNPALNVPDFTR